MKSFKGKVLFLDRSDINTDEIIPAKYLTEITKEALRTYLLEDLKLEGFDPRRDISGKSIIVARSNFGCGSSREHAPWALEVNGINMVIAPDFARIFRQNMYNCGMIALELPADIIESLFMDFSGKDTQAEADIAAGKLIISSGGLKKQIPFSLGTFDRELVFAGGWVGYANNHY